LKELERSILCIVLARGDKPATLAEFLKLVASHAVPDLSHHPWYAAPPDENFPIEQDLLSLSLFSNALRIEMERSGTRLVHMAARVLPERQLNQLLNQTRNKAGVLFSTSAVHLDHLLRNYGQQRLVIFCDRQGGREHYGQLLRLMFEEWALEIVQEKDGHAEYLLHQPRGATREAASGAGVAPPVRAVARAVVRQRPRRGDVADTSPWPWRPGRMSSCPLPTLKSSAGAPLRWPVNGPNQSLSWRKNAY